MFWLFPGFPATFREFTTRSVYSIEPLAVLQTNHDPIPIIYLNLKFSIMKPEPKQHTNRSIMIDHIEEELGMTIDAWEWSDQEIQDMYDTLIGSMYNGIYWNR